jgi:hypothetical protein
MVERRRRWGAGALALVLAVTACSGDDDTAPTTATPPDDPVTTTSPSGTSVPPTAPTTSIVAPSTSVLPEDPGELGILDAALTDEGTVDLDDALSLVAAGYGPIPGVTPAERPLAEGGPALRTVLASATDLAAEQRDVVTAIAARGGIPLAEAAGSSQPRLAAAAGIVTEALETFGHTPSEVPISLLELPYDNGDGTYNFSSPDSLATAVLVRADERDDCRIRINSTGKLDKERAVEDPAFVAAVARETFHCIQYVRSPAIEDVPVWVVEGAAAFAAEQVAGANPVSRLGWERWISQPQRPLARRSYDAIGFFALVAEAANAYQFAEALLGDPSPASVRRRLELTAVFDLWGQRYAMQPGWGEGFAFQAPSAAGMEAPVTPVELQVDGEPITIGGGSELAAGSYGVRVPGDVLVVTATAGDRGVMRTPDGQATPLAQANQSICVRPGGCACPGVDPDELGITTVEGTDVWFGIGPSSGPGVSVAARSLPRWCQEVALPPPADAIDPCLVGTWETRAYVAPGRPGVAQQVTGGTGATITFEADGTVRVDMSEMEPVVITTSGPSGEESTTTLGYRGTGTGTWRADDGVVEVAGVDPAPFGITLTVAGADGSITGTADLAATDVRAAGYATLLGTARYLCTPVSLTLTHVLPGVGEVAGFELVPS